MAEFQFRLESSSGTPAGTLDWTIPTDQMPTYPYEPHRDIDANIDRSHLGRSHRVLHYTKRLWNLHFQNVNDTTRGTLEMFATENKDIFFYTDINTVLGTAGTYQTIWRNQWQPFEQVRGLWNIEVVLESTDSPQSQNTGGGTGWVLA